MPCFRRNSHPRAGATVGWLALLSCLVVFTPSAQPVGRTPGPTAAAGAGGRAGQEIAGAAECSLYVLGGEGRIINADMRCRGPQPTIELAAAPLKGFTRNFTGVAFPTSSCVVTPIWTIGWSNGRYEFHTSNCLVTICTGRLVLRRSSVSGVRGISELHTLVCVVGDSRLEVHDSMFSGNDIRPLAVFDQAELLLNASVISDNSVMASGGGLVIAGRANVTITGRSIVQGNNASFGGGVAALNNATLWVDGNSSVIGNKAGDSGGGLFTFGNVTVTITGGSTISNNLAKEGGGVFMSWRANATITGRSSVHGNTAREAGGGLFVQDRGGTTLTITDGSSVHGNKVLNGTGGGLYVMGGARVAIRNQSFVSNNTCSGGVGGGIAVDVLPETFSAYQFDSRGRSIADDKDRNLRVAASRVTVSNSIIMNNTSIRSAGGGLAVVTRGTIELDSGTVVSRNEAVNSSGGGAVLLRNGTLIVDDSVLFASNVVSKGYVGSTIAAFENSTLRLPRHGGDFTKCSPGVYLGWSNCGAGEVMQHDVCVCCPPHTFSFINASCEPCPRNANCTGGNNVQPLPGYWSSAPTSVQMHRCPLSTTSCNYTGPNHKCNEGYTGPLCGACELPQYGMLGPFRCGKCMPPKSQLGLYMLLSFVSVLFVAYTVHATWKDNLTGEKKVLVTDVIKVLVQFLQYTVIIGSVSVPWPLFDVQRWFQAVNIVFAVGSGQALSLDCWLYHYIPQGKLPLAMQRQLVYFLAPVVVLLTVVAMQWLTWALGRWVVPLVWRGAKQQRASWVMRMLPVTLLVVAYYAYPTLLRASLSFFACLPIDRLPPDVQLPPGATSPLNHTTGYFVSDIHQECFAGYHKGWAFGLGLPSVLFWCVVVPVTMGVGLFLCRSKADEESFREHFGFLYRSYVPERVWWEAVWAARTVVLTLVSVFAYPMGRYLSVISLLVVFWASAALQNICQPYAFPTLHRMHMVSTSCCCCCCLAATTLGALVMFAYDIQESTALRLRITIAVLVVVVNITFVGWCLWNLVPLAKQSCVTAYRMVKSCVLWVVKAVLLCMGQARCGRGKPCGRGARHTRV